MSHMEKPRLQLKRKLKNYAGLGAPLSHAKCFVNARLRILLIHFLR